MTDRGVAALTTAMEALTRRVLGPKSEKMPPPEQELDALCDMGLAIEREPVPLVTTRDGVVLVAGTRVSLDLVVASFLAGSTAEEIVQRYPVSLADAYATLTYYRGNSMRVIRAFVLLGCWTGCDTREEQATNVNASTEALVQTNASAFRVAFTGASTASRLPEIFSATPPNDFRWVALEVGNAHVAEAHGPNGFVADMADGTAQVTFSQNYQDVCNPAQNDYSPCWFIEKYTSGSEGFTGHVSLTITATKAISGIDVTWEGLTDRYVTPPTYYKHGTTTGFTATISGGGQ